MAELKVRSWFAKYWSTDGRAIMGGVLRGCTSRFQSELDATARLISVISINNAYADRCRGEVVPSELYPEILYHCGNLATAIGCLCPQCRKKVTLKFAKKAKPITKAEAMSDENVRCGENP